MNINLSSSDKLTMTLPSANVNESQAFFTQLNDTLDRAGVNFEGRFDARRFITQVEDGTYQKIRSKTLSGASVATGSGLFMNNYDLNIYGTAPLGGAMLDSGINFKQVSGSSAIFQARQRTLVHTYTDKVIGSAGSNDSVGTMLSPNIALSPYELKFEIEFDVVQGYLGNEAALYSFFQDDAAKQFKGLVDDLCIRAMLGVTNITSTTPGTTIQNIAKYATGQFPVTRAIVKAVNTLRRVTPRAVVHLSMAGLNTLLNEQDSQGNFANSNDQLTVLPKKFTLANANGELPQVGLVGYIAGSPVYVNNAISDVYTAATNPITSLTGGTATAAFVFNPDHVGAAKGKNAITGTKLFSDDQTAWTLGVARILTNDLAGAAVINPASASYTTFVNT